MKTDTTTNDPVRGRAIDAALAVFTSHRGMTVPDRSVIGAALDAAAAVYDDDQRATIEQLRVERDWLLAEADDDTRERYGWARAEELRAAQIRAGEVRR